MGSYCGEPPCPRGHVLLLHSLDARHPFVVEALPDGIADCAVRRRRDLLLLGFIPLLLLRTYLLRGDSTRCALWQRLTYVVPRLVYRLLL